MFLTEAELTMRAPVIAVMIVFALCLPLAAQNAPAAMQASTTTATLEAAATKMTYEQALRWRDKPVHSSDDKKIGEVKSFSRSGDETVLELQADIGGFMGVGGKRIRLTPAQFELERDRVVLKLTAEQVRDLPRIQK